MATILTDPRASGAGRPIATGGFKVDISRGERIGRVSSEWFSRPDDERYLSLSALHDAVLRRAERATARTVETREVRVEAMRTVAGLTAAYVVAIAIVFSVFIPQAALRSATWYLRKQLSACR